VIRSFEKAVAEGKEVSMKKKLLFVISQFYKGGAESALLNLFKLLDKEAYEVDFLVMNQMPAENAVSLIPMVPSWIRLCDVFQENLNYPLPKRARGRFLYTIPQKDEFPRPALDFVFGKQYDWAFHVGEWYTPVFVAREVNAAHKAAWIHTDLSKASYFNAKEYFRYDDAVDSYIFVSQNALKSSVEAYPLMKEKAAVIYNPLDLPELRKMAQEPTEDVLLETKRPIVLTVANIRTEKGHLRQLEAMRILKQRGVNFTWLNIGSLAYGSLVEKVREQAKAYGLEKDFLLLGSRSNPYRYMRYADAVAVLSDFESWSMVITEAKTLRVPVIATRTAGALEQIVHGENGILTDFTPEDIADKLELLLTNEELRQKIRDSLTDFDNTTEIVESFGRLVSKEELSGLEKDILFVFDDVNYPSGAKGAALHQMDALQRAGHKVAVFSGTEPNLELRMRLPEVRFYGWHSIRKNRWFNSRVLAVLLDRSWTAAEKAEKVARSFMPSADRQQQTFRKCVMGEAQKLFGQFKTVCVVSEGSIWRKDVANCSAQKKIQWIHTDYAAWKNFSDWTRHITKDDGQIYQKFDTIVLLSEQIRNRFIQIYPQLAPRTKVLPNSIDQEEILQKGQMRSEKPFPPVHFVTVGRLSQEKSLMRLLKILYGLKEEGYRFHWDWIGDGPEWNDAVEKIQKLDLTDCVTLRGAHRNPFRYVKNAQVFALLSSYEGLPNTIYEAFVLGVPVLATAVGGIPEQISQGKNGWLAANTEKGIRDAIVHILENQNEIERFHENLQQYHYPNEMIEKELNELFEC